MSLVSHVARTNNLEVQSQNNTHCTCSCCEYCHFVPLDQCCTLSLCQECARKATNEMFVRRSVLFFADSLCCTPCPSPITMYSATYYTSNLRPIVYLDGTTADGGGIDRSSQHAVAQVKKPDFLKLVSTNFSCLDFDPLRLAEPETFWMMTE